MEEDLDAMLIRLAYVIFMHNVDKGLLINMDETPLMWLARSGSTWGDKGAKNVSAHGAKDKRQMTGTPWVTYEGIIAFFHTTIKGKTEACLPKAEFRGKEVFDSPKVLFGHSENHWVTKETMREQVLMVEDYRRSVVQEKNLPEDSKMIILWDVYCRHRDDSLKIFIAQHCPNIIVLFVPANLTEKGQPLDIFFNAILKVNMYKLRDARIMDAVTKHMEGERQREEAAKARGDKYKTTVYKPATKLSEIKEPFYLDLAQALKEMQTQELVEQLHNKAWGLFHKCFDQDFQG